GKPLFCSSSRRRPGSSDFAFRYFAHIRQARFCSSSRRRPDCGGRTPERTSAKPMARRASRRMRRVIQWLCISVPSPIERRLCKPAEKANNSRATFSICLPMSLPNLDMDALRSLEAILRLGGLARAAERISRSPSAISQQMRKLELQLGEPLFRKQGRRVVLTEAGDRVHAYARRILELNDEAVHAVRGAAIDGAVRFGLPGDFAESWLPAALGKFRKAYPAVRVDVLVERNALLLERLDRGELDLVLAMNQSKRADAELLATLPMAWIGPAGTGEVVRPDAVL